MKHLYILMLALIVSFSSLAITGPANVCINTTTTYTDPAPGGTWVSSNPAVASIQSTTGVLTSYTAGTIVLTYSNGPATNTFTVTVVSSLPPIWGASGSVCTGSTISLSNAVSGGTWSCSNTARATVDAVGTVTGASAGSAYILYKLGGTCTATQNLAVNATFSGISGSPTICTGNYLTLSAGGATGVWTASNTNAHVNTAGGVSGYTPGAVTITFTNSTSCGSASATFPMTVIAGISANTGFTTICAGSSALLSNSTAGGTWSSTNTNVATVDVNTGLVSAISSGYMNIVYSIPSGCYYSSSLSVTAGATGLSGSGTACTGATLPLSLTGGSSSGTWSSSNTNIATVSGGLVFGVGVGSVTITFTNGGSCGSPVLTTPVTVVTGVAATTGPTTMCTGTTAMLTNTTPGGTWWSSSIPGAATVDPTGLVSAVSVGEAFIYYSISSGCSYSHTIHVTSTAVTVSGPATLCTSNTGTMGASLSGGTWTSSNTTVATINNTTGLITPVAPGTAVISYGYSGSCGSGTVTHNLTVTAGISPTSAPATMCVGSTVLLSNSTPGGTWSSGTTSAATIDPPTGIATAVYPGWGYVRYAIGSCSYTATISVLATPNAITGASSVCIGATSPLSCSTTGGTWSSSNPFVATIDASGVVSGLSSGTTVINYTILSGCSAALTLTVGSSLTITATATPLCNGGYLLSASGGVSYSWSPATGLSCAACTTPSVNPSTTTNYVVTGTSSSCSGTGNVTVNGNRIRGNISYSGIATDSFRVWLIRYNPIDSTVLAVDSTTTCMDGTTPYYQFTNPAAGSYTVKAKKLGAVPGISGYIPTYGLGSANWFAATAINHTTATDLQQINMIYGTVPSGPGFIGGNVYFGAGKGTTGDVPAVDMLIFLRNTATNVLTYAYTDATGAYSFSNLAYGDYVIYPEEFNYYTTPSAVITLSAATPFAPAVNFKQHTELGTITPYDITGIATTTYDAAIKVFPNPATNDVTISWGNAVSGEATVSVMDVTGREVTNKPIHISNGYGQSQVNVGNIANGIYIISIKGTAINYNGKLEVKH